MRPTTQTLHRFIASRKGVAVIEFALIAPALLLVVLGSITLFKAFSDANRVESATYTVADIISRETTVSSDSLAVDYAMFVKMLPATKTGVKFRVSSIKKANNTLSVDWSYPVSPMVALTDALIPTAKLPLFANSDSLILVETSVGYAALSVFGGLGDGSYDYVAANRPRFTAAIVKSD